MAEALAEALRLRQEAKLAEARREQQAQQRAAARSRRAQRSPSPAAEQARLAAQGEKLLKRQEAERAREVARIEANLAKREGQRKRDAEARDRERLRAEKERQKTEQQVRVARLAQEAEERTQEVAQQLADLDGVLLRRPRVLDDWYRDVEQALVERGPQGLAETVEEVLRGSPVPAGCRDAVEAGYAPEAREVALKVDLPGLRVVPAVVEYRFVARRAQIVAQPRKEAEVREHYRALVARLALRALDEVFSMTPAALVDSIALNGFVSATDPATGRGVRPCVISVVARRADVEALVLDEPGLDPQRCLRGIGAVVSEHPHDLEPVPPVVEIDLSRYRITADAAAVTGLDSRPDLLQMDPFVFERLVRELFEAMGYETWRTQGSRDDGIDAVAVKRDALVATHFAIQAKRTKNVVPVDTVRSLWSTMHDVGASHSILVATSWYGKSSHEFAHRMGRIHLINGRELKALLLEHLGIDALIGLPKVPPGWVPDDVV
ncbi:restriction endonuclease [Actinacidiphila acididurans]|uniref:Restriction endonuclease n=1 Tax=Actinacidiphila acididurans TaxID=2784346 RepID=A0ABS2TVI6_9ACTN|nr:restriction endonuclease [Actinacidiphila acididurans]MBM9506812.1 restriction endonuclease [Actinacidiphila acididurans]